MRDKSYRRDQRERHIKRKEQILRKCRPDNPPHRYDDRDLFGSVPEGYSSFEEGSWIPYWYEKSRGYLAKGKIHSRQPKTRNKGNRRYKYGNYCPAINFKHSDLKKIQQMKWDEENWKSEEPNFISYIINLVLKNKDISDIISEEEFLDIIDAL